MSSGKRDTLIKVEHRAAAQDPVYGTPVPAWAEYTTLWAEVQDVLPSRAESLDDSVSITRRPARIRVDYMDGLGITAEMRIDIDGRKLRIVSGPAVKGRKDELEMMVEELSTAGIEP